MCEVLLSVRLDNGIFILNCPEFSHSQNSLWPVLIGVTEEAARTHPLCLEWLLRGQLLVIPIVLIDYNGGKVNFLPKGMLPSEKARNSLRVISSEEIYFQIFSRPELPYLVLSWHLFFLLSLIVWYYLCRSGGDQ